MVIVYQFRYLEKLITAAVTLSEKFVGDNTRCKFHSECDFDPGSYNVSGVNTYTLRARKQIPHETRNLHPRNLTIPCFSSQ